MDELALLTKAPLPYRIGDKTYEVSPLTQGDFGQFQDLVKFKDYLAVQTMDVPQEVKERILDRCLAQSVDPTSPAMQNAYASAWGNVEVAFLSLRHRQPDITRELINSWPMADVSNIGGLAVMLSNRFPDEPQKKRLLDLIARLKELAVVS